jgi:hypothetical protein
MVLEQYKSCWQNKENFIRNIKKKNHQTWLIKKNAPPTKNTFFSKVRPPVSD